MDHDGPIQLTPCSRGRAGRIRWAFPRDTTRPDRVRLEVGVTRQLVPGSIKVLTRVGMEATASSTMDSTFTNEGGSIRFANLAAVGGPAFTGESVDIAGTLEWKCGPIPA